MIARLLFPALLVAILIAAPIAAEPISIPAIGVRMERPDNWQQLSAQDNLEGLRSVEFANPEDRRQAIEQLSGLPLIVLVRESAADAPVSPTLRVTVESARRLGNLTPVDFLREVLTFFSRNFPDTRVDEGPVTTRRFGADGALLRVSYTVRGDFGESPVRAQMWVVRSGELFFIMGVSMARGEPDTIWAEAEAILDSVRITGQIAAR